MSTGTRKRRIAWGSEGSNNSNTSERSAPAVRRRTRVRRRASQVNGMEPPLTRRSTQQQTDLLNTVCGKIGTDLCLSLSEYREDVLTLFQQFIYFNNVNENTYRLGKPSANGFIRKIIYNVRNITSHAILKSSASRSSDNLAYEYTVGLFLNKYRTIFPCFVQTYGLYYYKSEQDWLYMRKHQRVPIERVRNSLSSQERLLPSSFHAEFYKKMCKQSKYAAILIEDIASKNTLGSYLELDEQSLNHFAKFKLVYILYQIYFPLAVLSDRFTHYDLHPDNVMLYEPSPGKYIQYHYHLQDGTEVTFKSTFIAKIIDYGRAFYFEDQTNNSLEFRRNLCITPECTIVRSNRPEAKCGEKLGFLTMSEYAKIDWKICSYERNASHDLRLLSSIRSEVPYRVRKTNELTEFNEMLSQVTYGEGTTYGNEPYGTEENLFEEPDKINNVQQAEAALRHILRPNTDLQTLNDSKYGSVENKLGDLHMYTDGTPMHFEFN